MLNVQLKSIYGGVFQKMSPYCRECFERFGEIPMVTDDAAMIVGGTVRILPCDIDIIKDEMTRVSAFMTEDGRLFCIGRNDYEARTCHMVLDKNAEIYLKALKLGEPIILDREHCRREHSGYLSSYSKKEQEYQSSKVDESPDISCTGDEREAAFRESIVEYGIRLQETGLVAGSWGNLSVRLDEEHMLCTPSGIDYSHMTADQIVKVRLDNLEYEGKLKPTSEKFLHSRIYNSFPEADAIIHTHSAASSAYAVAGKDITWDGHTIACAEYALAGTPELAERVYEASSRSSFGCLMRSHGLIVYGTSLEDAFNKAVLTENAAEKSITGIF
ncbi:MAG: class II aldolase/adducin family protein [Anaerovoracaceae bacterium]